MNITTELLVGLADIGAIKFGSFKLKSGITSPVYFDMRVTVSYPRILKLIGAALWERVQNVEMDLVCGVPLTALPFATVISVNSDKPMVMRRKEAKGYGTNKTIEGVFQAGQRCLCVEDVVTSGASIEETAVALRDEGLVVSDAVVLLDREQGGKAMLESKGIKLYSVFTVTQVLDVLTAAGKLDKDLADSVRRFVQEAQFTPVPTTTTTAAAAAAVVPAFKRKSYAERATLTTNPVAKKLFALMESKQTNLCLAADLGTGAQVLAIAEAVGPHICVLKTHVDAIDDFTPDFVEKLQALAVKHNFLIFEDRKFADIGNTVQLQYRGGVFKIVDWADIITVHSVPGPGILQGLSAVGTPKQRSCLLLAEMSPEGNLAKEGYTKATVEMAKDYKDFVMGFICTNRLVDDHGVVHMTPGVQLEEGKDALGQRYLTPPVVIGERGSDVIIVGRGIYGSKTPDVEALKYREAGFNAYKASLVQ